MVLYVRSIVVKVQILEHSCKYRPDRLVIFSSVHNYTRACGMHSCKYRLVSIQ